MNSLGVIAQVGLKLCAAALLIAGVVQAATAQAPAPVASSEHGRAVAAAKCASCHGADGNSAAAQYPKLAGQDAGYLSAQLRAFKMRIRASDVMSAAIVGLSDADLDDAASFYARQVIRPDPVKDKTRASIGERIFFSGGPMAPSCAMCHGSGAQGGGAPMMGGMPMMGMMRRGMMGMMGMMGGGRMGSSRAANVPRLSDQHAGYLEDQLRRFADGERLGTVMNDVAAGLTETDRKAVAEYLSGLR